MDFALTPEQRMVRDLVRDFANREVLPRVAQDDERGRLPLELIARLGELGILGMLLPSAYGGGGMDHLSYVLAIEELGRVSPALAVTLAVNNSVGGLPIAKFGNEAQKEKYLRPIAEGKVLGAFALTEPGAGSNARGIETKARETEEAFWLSGNKIWVTNGTECSVVVVMAVTGFNEISAFLVEPGFEGVHIRLMEGKLGLHASSTAEISLQEARIPKENLLGNRGDGLKVALGSLEGGRIGVAAQALGIAQACYDKALAYAKQRKTFNKAMIEHEAIQLKLAAMLTRLTAARLLTYRAALERDQGKSTAKEASMAKLYATEAANFIAAEAIQIHGGYGFMEEFGVARFYRDARITTIYEGASEIQRMLIARQVIHN